MLRDINYLIDNRTYKDLHEKTDKETLKIKSKYAKKDSQILKRI